MREAWTGRTFAFDYPVERIGVFQSRVGGATSRIRAAVRGLTAAQMTARQGERWSLQEHVGHLFELDWLHLRRIEELCAGKEHLTAADMDNKATWDANYNDRTFDEVFDTFAGRRHQLLRRLSELDADTLDRTSLHPRLETPMRAVDVAFFCAEHDDNHIAAIESVAREAQTTAPDPVSCAWDELPLDAPMDLLERRRIIGSDAMISHITLHKGCKVPVHAHANEQFACVLSGKVRFTLKDNEVRDLGAGDVLHLRAHSPHGAEALETAVVLDIFSPPSETTGIDDK